MPPTALPSVLRSCGMFARLNELLICVPAYLSALPAAVAPRRVPQAGPARVREAGASSAAAGFQRSRLHDLKAAREAM